MSSHVMASAAPKRRALLGFFAAFALWVAYSAAVTALYLKFPNSPDDAVFDYIGWVALRGGTIYVDAADQNWPGMVFPHMLSTFLFGNTIDAYRKLDVILLFASSAVMAAYAYRSGLSARASLLIVPIYQAIYVSQSFWMVGQRDILATPLLLIASDAHLRRLEGRSRRFLLLEGAAIALATLLRPTMLAMAAGLGLANLWVRRREAKGVRTFLVDQIVVIAGLATVFVPVAVIGWTSGALAAWWSISIRYNLQVYSTHGPSLLGMLEVLWFFPKFWWWAIAIAAVGFGTAWRVHGRAGACLGLVVATSVLSFFVQGKGFGYHLGPLLPILAMGMAPGVDWAIDRVSTKPLPGVSTAHRALAFVICLFALFGLAKKIHGNLRPQIAYYAGHASTRDLLAIKDSGITGMSLADALDMGEYVKATTAEDAYFLLWGRPMYVNFVAERRSPSHIASFAMFQEPRASFDEFESWKARFASDLASKPPALICLGRGLPDPTEFEDMPRPGGEPRLSDVLYDELAAHYETTAERTFGKTECFRRRSTGSLAQHP